MAERHIPGKEQDNRTTSTNPEPVKKTFSGIAIGGVFMAPRSDESPDIIVDREHKIRTHQS